MKKTKVLLVFILALSIVLPQAYAANMSYSTDGWEAVGENEVQLKASMINLHTAHEQGGITLSQGFSLNENKQYTDAEYNDGSWRDFLSYETLNGYAITYDNPLSAGEHDIDGTINLKWENAATLSDGTLCDVYMTVSNIHVKNLRNTTKPIALLLSGEDKGLEASIFYAQQEFNSRNVPDYTDDIGAKFDVEFKITKASTDELVNKNMVFAFQDIDMPNKTVGTIDDYQFTYDNIEYVEGVTLINGVKDQIYLANGHYLEISDTTYGNNTDFSGTREIDNIVGGKPNTTEMRKAGFITLVDSNSFKFKWHGSGCRTGITGISTSKVITSTSGNYKVHAHITETDNEVLWKEDKTITMSADKGYRISKVTVDGKEVKFSTDADGTATYTFENVISDHTIDVQVEPAPLVVSVPKTDMAISIAVVILAVVLISVAIISTYRVTKKNK